MKIFLKIIIILIELAIITAGGLFAFTWIICGGGGIAFMVVMLAVPVVLFLMRKIRKYLFKKIDGNNTKIDLNKISSTERILVDYIINAQKEGLSKGKIVQNLVDEGGWNLNEVDHSYVIVNKKQYE